MAIESENMPSSSLVSKGNTTVASQLRTSAKIIRSMKEGLSSEIIRPLHKADPRKTRRRKHEKKTWILTHSGEKRN
jgi:putative ubiquitin-RnfH superfamily antitoxin RatB of RatAB toxin-antitoxin module